jgi:hypothetical protein
MARLILEEGGKRRAFRLKDGKITVGSGEGCTLTLASPGVAEVHLEIELAGGKATLLPRPGVLPPTLSGEPVSGPALVPDGATIEVGGARLVFDYEETSAAPPPAAAPRKRERKVPSAPPRQESRASRVERSRPRVEIKRGAPTWLILAIFGAGALAAFFVVRGLLGSMGERLVEPDAIYAEALRYYDNGAYDLARQRLDLIDDANQDVSPEVARKAQDLLAKIAEHRSDAELRVHNVEGTKWMETQLKRFVDERLQGDPKPERVRVFLMRCKEFRERWPGHPEMDWVDRYEERFSSFVDLSAAPTFADVEYEVQTLTWAMPRNYRKAFAVLDAFLADASPEDREKALAIVDRLRTEQQEYFTDRRLQARYLWEKEKQGEAVAWVVELIVGLEDAGMIQEAADELVRMPAIEEWLRGYASDYPEKFARLAAHPTVGEFVQRHGIR